MYKATFKGTIENAYGKPVSPALKFNGSYDAFGVEKPTSDEDWAAAVAEIREKNEFPKDEELVNFVNNKRKASARQTAMTNQLTAAGYDKPTLETDAQLQLRTVYKGIMAGGKKTEAEAKELASQVTGIEWVD